MPKAATILMIQPASKILTQLNVERIDATRGNIVSLTRQNLPCLLLGSLNQANDVSFFIHILRTLSPEIKAKSVRFMIALASKNPSVTAMLKQLGCTEIVEEPIEINLLMHKIEMHSNYLQNIQLAFDHSQRNTHVVGGKKFGKNLWVFSKDPPKQMNKKWTVYLDGPPDKEGEWIEKEKAADGTPLWHYHQEGQDSGWEWAGDKPTFNSGRWTFSSTEPQLNYTDPGKKEKQTPIYLNPEGKVEVDLPPPQVEEIQDSNLQLSNLNPLPQTTHPNLSYIDPGKKEKQIPTYMQAEIIEKTTVQLPQSHPSSVFKHSKNKQIMRKPPKLHLIKFPAPVTMAVVLSDFLITENGSKRGEAPKVFCKYLLSRIPKTYMRLYSISNVPKSGIKEVMIVIHESTHLKHGTIVPIEHMQDADMIMQVLQTRTAAKTPDGGAIYAPVYVSRLDKTAIPLGILGFESADMRFKVAVEFHYALQLAQCLRGPLLLERMERARELSQAS